MLNIFLRKGLGMRKALAIFSAVTLSLLSGCGGGFDCPFERPSCCDNVLFGCSIWDLPQGCSCDDYFLRSFNGAKLADQTPRMSRITPAGVMADTTGTWRATGAKTVRTACPIMPQSSTSTILVREQNKKVSMKVLGYTTLSGTRVGDVVRAQGAYKMAPLKCEAFIKAEMTPNSAVNAPMTVNINWVCKDKKQSCSVTFSGVAKKLG